MKESALEQPAGDIITAAPESEEKPRGIEECAKNLRELENERSMFQTMLNSVTDLIFCKDTDLNYTRCNKSLLEYFGLTEEELVGKDDEAGLKIPQKIAEEYRAMDHMVMKEKKAITYEEYVPVPDGSMRLFETNKVPLLVDDEPIGIMGIARDVTERKAMEEAAKNASRAKSTFLTNMSHEIRTPINCIVGFAELALDGEISTNTRDYLNLIIENSNWLLQLVNDLLDISKIETGNMSIEKIPFDLHEMFVSCKTMIMPKAIEKNIDLFFYAEPFIGKMLVGDPTRLRQVLINLLSNSVKFTKTGTVKLAAVIVNESEDGNFVDDKCTLRFEVKDTGIGMTAEQIDKIIEPFTQADASTTRRYGGTGLGLSITKNIIELMGGVLIIESKPDSGTKISFEITFDVTDTAAKTIGAINVIDDIEKPKFEGDVLVCEDNYMNQRVIVEHLVRVGLNVDLAENGQEGVDIVRRRIERGIKPYDVIMMDIHMPVMDGIEATPEIIGLDVDTPIIAMTANVMVEDIELYKKIGMVDHIGKPFSSKELWSILLKYLEPISFESTPDKVNVEDDDKFQVQLKSDFVKGNQNTFNEIKAAMNLGDIKLAHRLSHSLKNNAGIIDRTALQKAAAAVETTFKKGEKNPTDEQMDLLQKELNIALSELKPYVAKAANIKKSEAGVTDMDANEIRETYDKLEPLLERGSPESMKYIGQLSRIPGSEKLIEQIENFNLDAASEILAEMKKAL